MRNAYLMLLTVVLASQAWALAAGAADAGVASPTDEPPATRTALARVERSEDWMTVTGFGEDGAAAFVLTMDDWRGWAEEHLEAALGGPVWIGDVAVEPASFYAFGAAELTPDGARVWLAATTYAMLTTASVLTVLDPATMTLDLAAPEPAYGDVEEVAWSPDGCRVAYTLGSARASGDELRVDDTCERSVALEATPRGFLAASAAAGLPVEGDPCHWFPGFRELVWDGPDELTFVTSDPAVDEEEGGALHWRFLVADAEFRFEGRPRP